MTDQMMTATHESEQVIEEVDHNIKEDTMLSNPSSPRAAESGDLVGEIMAIIESLKTVGEFRKTQRKECHNLVRRLKLFMPVLEEIRDVDGPISDAGMECLKRLHKAFQSARKLLKLCHGGSKLFLALESEAMMVRFHTVYGKISQAVEGMPYDELGISEEEKEQIELLRVQLRRARKRTDTQDMELTMDLMVALSKDNDRNADKASIERLANKLGLHTADELKMETLAVQKLVKDRRGPSSDTAQQTVYLLEKLRQLGGLVGKGVEDVEHQEVTDDSAVKSTSSIPNEFLCPITLEIMTDPVIVATGQTYERESIQKWLDSCHKTCPKTGQILTHLSLAPNFALKNLIVQWCEKNNFHLPKKETPESTESLSTMDDEKILSLIQNLSSNTLDEQRQAVKKIRLLSKENPENRIMIANGGGIPPLVHLLSYPDSKIQEHSVTALLNLSIDDSNKRLISKNEPIPSIIEILDKGTVCGKENSAAALFSLSMLDENKVKIGYLNGIPPLVALLKSGTIRGKKDAVTALFNLCMNNSNKTRAIEAGIVTPLLKVLEDEKLEMVNETLSLLLILAGNLDGRQELGKLPFIESLVNFIRDGTNKNKECATAVLLELASSNHNLILAALQFGVYEHLVEVSKNGTERGQRKANALLRLMRNTEQIP